MQAAPLVRTRGLDLRHRGSQVGARGVERVAEFDDAALEDAVERPWPAGGSVVLRDDARPDQDEAAVRETDPRRERERRPPRSRTVTFSLSTSLPAAKTSRRSSAPSPLAAPPTASPRPRRRGGQRSSCRSTRSRRSPWLPVMHIAASHASTNSATAWSNGVSARPAARLEADGLTGLSSFWRTHAYPRRTHTATRVLSTTPALSRACRARCVRASQAPLWLPRIAAASRRRHWRRDVGSSGQSLRQAAHSPSLRVGPPQTAQRPVFRSSIDAPSPRSTITAAHAGRQHEEYRGLRVDRDHRREHRSATAAGQGGRHVSLRDARLQGAVRMSLSLAPPDDLDLAALDGAPLAERQLESTYFDTAERELLRHRVGLRHTVDGDGTGDLGARTAGRAAWSPLPRRESPPAESVDLVVALTRRAPLEPVAHVRTTRDSVRVGGKDAPLAEVVRDTISRPPGARRSRSFGSRQSTGATTIFAALSSSCARQAPAVRRRSRSWLAGDARARRAGAARGAGPLTAGDGRSAREDPAPRPGHAARSRHRGAAPDARRHAPSTAYLRERAQAARRRLGGT